MPVRCASSATTTSLSSPADASSVPSTAISSRVCYDLVAEAPRRQCAPQDLARRDRRAHGADRMNRIALPQLFDEQAQTRWRRWWSEIMCCAQLSSCRLSRLLKVVARVSLVDYVVAQACGRRDGIVSSADAHSRYRGHMVRQQFRRAKKLSANSSRSRSVSGLATIWTEE